MDRQMKIVSLPITVPDSNFCWDGKASCEHFDNSGREATCTLGLGTPHWDQGLNSYYKPLDCFELCEL